MNVYGNGIATIGDLHESDIYKGSHINYLKNCFTVNAKILNKVEEMKPSALVLLGDVVGMNDRLIKRREVLCHLCNFFKQLNAICPVFAIRGNHDSGAFPEFSFLEGLGYIKTANTTDGFIDYYPDESFEVPEARFHLVDFGYEKEPLKLADGDVSNIVLAHNNFIVTGQTTWYSKADGIELNSLTNWCGVDMVVSGHIHNPSPMEVVTTMVDGSTCSLFYPGCPTRPTKDLAKYDHVHFTTFTYNEEGQYTDWNALPFELEPAEEVFRKEALESSKTDEELDMEDMTDEQVAVVLEGERRENLKKLINEVVTSNITTSDPIKQIEIYPNVSDNVKAICKRYFNEAVLAKNAKTS